MTRAQARTRDIYVANVEKSRATRDPITFQLHDASGALKKGGVAVEESGWDRPAPGARDGLAALWSSVCERCARLAERGGGWWLPDSARARAESGSHQPPPRSASRAHRSHTEDHKAARPSRAPGAGRSQPDSSTATPPFLRAPDASCSWNVIGSRVARLFSTLAT